VGRKFLELLVGNGGTGAVSFTSGGLLRGNNVGALSVASAADIVAAIGATFVTNATNATNATNTVNVGVTNDAATATRYFILGKCCFKISLPKFQVLIYLCSFYWYFSNRILRKWCCTNILQQLT
jgi:hypothetical protein